MIYSASENRFKSDGTRVAYLNANGTIKKNETRADVAERLRKKLITAFNSGKIRVIPRENREGNRLDIRRDIGFHYLKAAELFPPA